MSTPSKLIELLAGKVFKVRDVTVILDFDAAALYAIGIEQLLRSVTRHQQRFPTDFMFRLTATEWDEICGQLLGKPRTGRSKPPMAFTYGGFFMLSSVLKGPRAAELSVMIIETVLSNKMTVQ